MKAFKKISFQNVSKDLLYSVAGLCLMNGVIQLVVNPYLQNKMGSAKFGVMLSLISVLSVVSISFGTSFNYSRMIASTKKRDCNSDYFFMLLLSVIITVPICIAAQLIIDKFSFVALIGYIALTAITTFRYYGDVNFRLDVDFKGFFVYYALMAVGYLIGIAVFRCFNSWIIVYLLGEVTAVIFVAVRGKVFKCNPFKKTEYFNDNLRSSSALFLSNLITSVLANIDRPFILKAIDASSVTVFYAATLIGKIIALLTVPLNGVVISYLAKYDGKLSKKTFSYLCVFAFLATALLSVACTFISYVFVSIMYPNIYEQAKPLIPIAIIGQVFYFMSGTLMVVLLRFTDEKLQFIINGIYFAVYIGLCIWGVNNNGLMGFAFGILIANFLRMLITYIFGMMKLENKTLD